MPQVSWMTLGESLSLNYCMFFLKKMELVLLPQFKKVDEDGQVRPQGPGKEGGRAVQGLGASKDPPRLLGGCVKTTFPLQRAHCSSRASDACVFWGKAKLFRQPGKQKCMIYHRGNPQPLLPLLK